MKVEKVTDAVIYSSSTLIAFCVGKALTGYVLGGVGAMIAWVGWIVVSDLFMGDE